MKNYRLKASEADTIVCTKPREKCALYYSRPDNRNYCPADNCDYTTATKHRAKKLNNPQHAKKVHTQLNCLDKSLLPCRDKTKTAMLTLSIKGATPQS